ncbi:securin [Tiliqua scincoides]|uniref:securin n=1 Tax=Tiliqua scincoides TaxID=71010 RepID=UPI003461970C
MATHIFVDKENGETGTAVKDRLRLLSAPSKVFERSCPKTPLAGRTANVKPPTFHSSRKALGNVNRPLTATQNQIPKGKKALSAKKVTENTNGVEHCSMVIEECPEKENLFSYNPLDAENFEVPEEHRLSHMSLIGVPLMTFENVPDRFVSIIPSPVKPPSIAWDDDTLQSTKDFLATLDEIIIDLPLPM